MAKRTAKKPAKRSKAGAQRSRFTKAAKSCSRRPGPDGYQACMSTKLSGLGRAPSRRSRSASSKSRKR